MCVCPPAQLCVPVLRVFVLVCVCECVSVCVCQCVYVCVLVSVSVLGRKQTIGYLTRG